MTRSSLGLILMVFGLGAATVATFIKANQAPSLSDIQATWRSEADMSWGTRSSPSETGEDFAERAGREFTEILKRFPRK